MHRVPKVMLAVVLMLGSAGSQANDVKQFDYPGARSTALFDVNDRGIALGGASIGLDFYPFLLNLRTGELTNITPIPGFYYYLPNAIDNAGTIVGGIIDRDDGSGVAFIRRPDETYTYFSHPKARSITTATAISERGLIAGERDTPEGGYTGFIYNPATGGFRNFHAGEALSPRGINKFGKVVGNVIVLKDEDPCGGGPAAHEARLYGFVRHTDGFITLFQVNRQQTYGGDVDDDGRVVGTVYDPPATKPRIFSARIPKRRCVFLKIARQELRGAPGVEYVVEGINDFGRVVGFAIENPPEGFIHHGFYTTLKR